MVKFRYCAYEFADDDRGSEIVMCDETYEFLEACSLPFPGCVHVMVCIRNAPVTS